MTGRQKLDRAGWFVVLTCVWLIGTAFAIRLGGAA